MIQWKYIFMYTVLLIGKNYDAFRMCICGPEKMY